MAQKMDVGKQRKETMAFSSVVGGVKTVYWTKTSRKVFVCKTDGPSKGAEVHLVTTIRRGREIGLSRIRRRQNGGNHAGCEGINHSIVTSVNMKMFQKKMAPSHKGRISIKNVGRRGWGDRKLTRSKTDSDIFLSRENMDGWKELVRDGSSRNSS